MADRHQEGLKTAPGNVCWDTAGEDLTHRNKYGIKPFQISFLIWARGNQTATRNEVIVKAMRIADEFAFSSSSSSFKVPTEEKRENFRKSYELMQTWSVKVLMKRVIYDNQDKTNNRPFPSSLLPLFQSDSKCETIF